MKFKCAINQNAKMLELLSIVNTLSKYSEHLNIITRPETMTFTVPQSSNKPLVWFDLNNTFFSDYKLEGVNPEVEEDNLIYFEVNTNFFSTALSTSKRSVNVIEIKLAKEEFPYFKISMKVQTGADPNKCVDISNQVPVIIIPRKEWDIDLPYGTIDFDTQAKCPRLPIFKKYIDTFKNHNIIKLTMRRGKTLTIEANSDTSKHVTIFNGINVQTYPSEDRYKGTAVSAIVEQKKISSWINSLTFHSRIKLYCMIEHNRTMKLFFRLRDDLMASLVVAAEFEEESDDDSDIEIGPSV